VSWGKIDPDLLPDTVVCYVDSTVAMPLIASYVLAKCKPRKPRRLYKRLHEMEEALRAEYLKSDSLRALLARHRGRRTRRRGFIVRVAAVGEAPQANPALAAAFNAIDHRPEWV
jgi:deoxyhypusine synthase